MHFCVMDSIPVLALTDVAWVAALDLYWVFVSAVLHQGTLQ